MPISITPLPNSLKWKEPSFKVYVVSGTFEEYKNYVNKKRSEGSTDDYYQVISPQFLYGLSEIKGVFIGSWKQRTDIEEIKLQINIIKSRMEEKKAYDEAANKLAKDIDQQVITGIMAQDVSTILPASITELPITLNGEPYITNSRISVNGTGSNNLTWNMPQQQLTGEEQWFKDLMKKYIDEALKNLSTRGEI